MMKEMSSMKDFGVYDEVLVKDCTEEQVQCMRPSIADGSKSGRMRLT